MNEQSTATTIASSVSALPRASVENDQKQGEQNIQAGGRTSENAPHLNGANTSDIPSSTFEKGTIEINLQFLPHDGHAEGRRIRNALVVNGKVLRVGSLRVNNLPALLSSLAGQSPDQVLERLAAYVAECQQQVGAIQQLLAQKTPPKQQAVHTSSIPQPAQPSLLETATALDQPTTVSSQRFFPPVQESHPGSGPQIQEPANDAETPVQQLTLFS